MTHITPLHLKKRFEMAKSGNSYRKLAIFFDLSDLESGLAAAGRSQQINFYRKVFARTGDWWGNALWVNDDRSVIAPGIAAHASTYPKELGFQMGEATMGDYDLYVRAFWGQ